MLALLAQAEAAARMENSIQYTGCRTDSYKYA